MSDTINIGGITVSKFYLGGSSDVKIYLGTTKLYPHLQEPCFAVVDNISTYTARTYVDVYETSSDKWYKLNNLNAYEEYGIYGSGRNITTYEGKLTIDGDYEYQYSGNSWVNVGEVSGETEDYSQCYLTLQALESGTIGFSVGTVDYSTDSGSTWNTLAQGNTISVSQGDEVLFKKSGSIPTENYGIGTFTSSCRFNVYGNIMSMQEADNFATATTIANYEFYFKRLFAESKVVSAENMVLPATTLQNFCYNELFNDATYLTTPPKIFPATALTQDCYSFAFNSCTSLTKTPVLPALTAARASYGWMFQNCTSLSEVSCLATDVSATYATYDWLSNVASSGTFYKNPNASWSRGANGIPSNWNVEDYVEPTPSVYPVYYDEIQDPPNNVTFTSMTEAESYECPWVGMKATIAGDHYVFSGDSQSGYEWVEVILPYTELQWIEMPQTSPYCAVQLVDSYSGTSYLYYDFELLFNTLQDVRIIGFDSYAYMVGYGGSSIYLQHSRDTAQFNVSNQFTSGVKYHFGLGKRNSTSNNTFDNLDASTTYATFNTSLLKTKKPYFGAISQGSSLLVNGESERIYSIKVYDNEVLVGNYIPVKRNSDNFVTLYDTVSEQFCDTVGGGTMVAGPTA